MAQAMDNQHNHEKIRPVGMRFAAVLLILDGGQLDGVRIFSRKTIKLMMSNSVGDLYAPFRYHTGDKMGCGFGIRAERGQFDELESLGILSWDGASSPPASGLIHRNDMWRPKC